MTVAGELVAALTDAGLGVPVAAPGAAAGALPRVQVTPADDTAGSGNRYLVHGYDVVVMVARDAMTSQLDRLEELTTATYSALVQAGYDIGARIRFSSGDGESVDYLAKTIPIARAGEVICIE